MSDIDLRLAVLTLAVDLHETGESRDEVVTSAGVFLAFVNGGVPDEVPAQPVDEPTETAEAPAPDESAETPVEDVPAAA